VLLPPPPVPQAATLSLSTASPLIYVPSALLVNSLLLVPQPAQRAVVVQRPLPLAPLSPPLAPLAVLEHTPLVAPLIAVLVHPERKLLFK
jgi:hypothetical protein